MKVLNIGSLNIDHVYRMSKFVAPGETLPAQNYSVFPGGKGLNQSIALARAGADCKHAGAVAKDDTMLRTLLKSNHVDDSMLFSLDTPTGHAVIQVDDVGENCIILFGGANQAISKEMIDKMLTSIPAGSIVLFQNETSNIPYAIKEAHRLNMRVFINPAPMTPDAVKYPYELVDTVILNEIEAAEIAGVDNPSVASEILRKRYPDLNVLITLGAKGAVYYRAGEENGYFAPAEKVGKIVDTTAAGDTFIGYFITGLAEGLSINDTLRLASKASALCIARAGAAVSIPYRNEIE